MTRPAHDQHVTRRHAQNMAMINELKRPDSPVARVLDADPPCASTRALFTRILDHRQDWTWLAKLIGSFVALITIGIWLWLAIDILREGGL